MDLAQALLNIYVILYLVIVIGAQAWIILRIRKQRQQIQQNRAQQGLPSDILLNHSERLSDIRNETLLQSSVLLVSIIVTPFLIMLIFGGFMSGEARNGLAVIFLGLLGWMLFNGTDVAKSFLGGLAFNTLLAFKHPIQVGDRVTLKGHGGKVLEVGLFFVKLQTPNDDLISIPTRDLWSEVLVSANAGERYSLCVMEFYLAPFCTQAQRQAAEDTIWEAIQASPYFEPNQPMQIFLAQQPDAIRLTAKAYVASTYNEPLFTSDVIRAFLEFADQAHIPLASQAWRTTVSNA